MVALCVLDANGVNEQLIDKYCGWGSVNLILTTDINIVKKNVKFL
jgi:hypothetical protein